MKNILVTGSSGFIGYNLVNKLVDSYNVVGIDNLSNSHTPATKHENFKFINCNIENLDDLDNVFAQNKIDSVIHLAAKVGVRDSIKHPQMYAQTNIIGTLNLLECIKKHNCKKLIFSSSSSVYGNCKEPTFKENNTNIVPISPYAETKLAGEKFCKIYSDLYDINTICLRLFTVYGPYQRSDLAISKFTKLITEEKPVPMYGNGETLRDYTYVDDVTDAIIKALNQNNIKYEILNVGNESPTKLCDIISLLGKCIGKQAEIEQLPMQKGDVDKTCADKEKCEKVLNFKTKITIETGIKKYIDWYNKHV